MKKDKGFTMIELLAAIVIMGILSTIAIAAVSNLSKRAKNEKDKQNANTLKIAAESYAQANKEYLPKLIGESTKIEIKDLSDNKYIKEDIKNQDEITCMEKSYVEVVKVSKTEYVYNPYLVCGSETIDVVEDETNPLITITINDGTTKTTNNKITSENIQQANYSITFKGNEDKNKKVGIVSYNYSLYVKKKEKGSSEDSELFEVFNSGNLLGNDEPEISVKNVSISEYLNISGENEVEVRAFLVNKEGKKKQETAKIDVFSSETVTISDTTAPVCPESPEARSGEPNDDNWMGKKEIKDGETRVISLLCNDGQGAGCKRERFSKTWPSQDEKKAKQSIQTSTITLTDNAGNSSNCPVKVNIDVESPSLTVLSDSNIKNDVTVEANSNYDDLNPSTTIQSTKTYYNNLYNNWLNQEKYPNGIEYSVKASDNMGIRRISWTTSGQTEGEIIADEQLNIDTNVGGDYNVTTSSDGIKIYTFKVRFSHDGRRKGTLVVEDNAGNKTTINIEANIDRTPPTIPKINFYKWTNNDGNDLNTNTDTSKLNKYIPNTNTESINSWSNYKIFTIADPATDKTSGVGNNNYSYTVTGKEPNETNVKSRSKNIKAEGISSIYYKITDNAGNSINTQTFVVATDYTPPTCENISKCKIGGVETDNCPEWINQANSTNSSVTITAICSDNHDGKQNSGCMKEEAGSTEYNANRDIVTDKAGAGGIEKAIKTRDNAGNEVECPADKTIKIDITPPPIPSTQVYPWKDNKVSPTTMSQVGDMYKPVSITAANSKNLCTSNCNCASGNNCEWTKYKLYTRPFLTEEEKQSDSSGVASYKYKTTGTTTNSEKVKGWRKIEADGYSAIVWKSIDKAGNESEYNTPTVVKISKHAPNPTCKIDSNDGHIYDINPGSNTSGFKTIQVVRSMATTVGGIQATWVNISSNTKVAYNSTNAKFSEAEKKSAKYCDKTYYGYIKVVTNNGITVTKRCSQSFSTYSCNNGCSDKTPEKCPWVTSCRAGYTILYVDHNSSDWEDYDPIYVWAGTAYHSLSGGSDRIYVLSDSKPVKKYGVTWVRVYIPSYDDYYGDHFVYIAKNCLGPYNKVCPYTQCPG